METLDLFEPATGLDDLVGILENMFVERLVFVRLEMHEERGELLVEHLLAQFASTLDLIDLVQAEDGQETGLEFLFRELDHTPEGSEPRLVTFPIDPQDVEVDLFDEQVVMSSGAFTLTVQRLAAVAVHA